MDYFYTVWIWDDSNYVKPRQFRGGYYEFKDALIAARKISKPCYIVRQRDGCTLMTTHALKRIA